MTTNTVAATPLAGAITLRCIELRQFRRLAEVQVDIDEKTTILVGANNSGKTSILAALRHFLSESFAFGAYDISLSQWAVLRELGKKWESLTESPMTAAAPAFDWDAQLAALRATMPTLDLWFNAEAGMYHFVAPFLSKFSWKGGAVGLRLRLEPASDVEEIRELAWAYNQARALVKDMGEHSLAWPIDLIDYWLQEPRRLGAVRVYKLDADNNPLDGKAAYTPQVLDLDAEPIDRKHLTKLIRVDFVAAQRGLGTEEAESRSTSGPHRTGLFSNQLLKFVRDHLKVASTGHGHRADLIQAVAEAQRALCIFQRKAPVILIQNRQWFRSKPATHSVPNKTTRSSSKKASSRVPEVLNLTRPLPGRRRRPRLGHVCIVQPSDASLP